MSREVMVTVAIPTRERLETLRVALATALDQRSDRFEVLVSDNVSADGTEDYVAGIRDSRLRYVKTGKRVPMSENWEFALSAARGEYIIIIGDDDAVLPGAIDRLIEDIERVPSDVYTWPRHRYVWPTDGRQAFAEFIARQVAPYSIDLAPLARQVVRFGGWRHYSLPSMYHTAVRRWIPEAVRERTGKMYHSTQPDVFMSICVPVFARSAWNVGYSVTSFGRSPKSNGGILVARDGQAVLERFIREYGDYQIHPSLYPGIPIAANLTPDSVLVARDLFRDYYRSVRFDYEAMWAFICREAWPFRWGIKPAEVMAMRHEVRRYHRFSTSRFLAYLAMHGAAEVRARVINRWRRRLQVPADIAAFVRSV